MTKTMKAIYPEIEIGQRSGGGLIAKTTLRKEHKGKWYFWDFVQSSYDLSADKLTERLRKEVYLVIILGKVQLDLVNYKGEPIFVEDPNQTSEESRLKELNKFYSNQQL